MIQGCVGKVGIFKRSDTIVSSICPGSAYDMLFNPTLYVMSTINSGGCNLQGENPVLFYLNMINHFLN